ncbi:MAG: peptidoglycan DD-metalloendopeptidase family protein [Bacilli bacterium]|nr:peptidoglycan DD-metalloendopeptidase family protein [Bacilli bacterium]
MNPDDKYIRRGKIILSISMLLLITAIGLFIVRNTNLSSKDFTLTYETIDIKTMGIAKVSLKKAGKDNIFSTIVSALEKNSSIKEVSLVEEKEPSTEIKQPVVETSPAVTPVAKPTKPTWRLPTEQGYITQYAHYNHIALDITSPRGTNERIYPVAVGVISSIYYDAYGAKIITINHYIDGVYYTSQYAHLSWFAQGIYVGQTVTTDTVIGGMGSTGLSTGVHLHLTVMDCNLYGDDHCADIGRYLSYGRRRVLQGFKGLDSLMPVPYSWYSR